MPNEPLNHLTRKDITNSLNLATTALFGVLKDDVTEAKKKEILKNIAALNIAFYDVNQARVLMDGQHEDFLEEMQNLNVVSPSRIPEDNWMDSSDFEVYTNPVAKKPLEKYTESMRELTALLDQKLKNPNTLGRTEKDFIYMMKGMTESLSRGESLTERYYNHPQMSFSANIFTKLYLSNGQILANPEDGSITIEETFPGNDDKKVFQNLEDTGIVQAAAGSVKVTEMHERYVTKGDVSKEELIDEYEEQAERLEKAFSLEEEEFNRLNEGDQKTFGNDYNDLFGKSRGYDFALQDAKIRAKLLKIGYTAEDLPALSQVFRVKNKLEVMAEGRTGDVERIKKEIANEEKKENPNQALLESKRNALAAKEEEQRKLKSAYDLLNEEWSDTADYPVVTETTRLERLNRLKDVTARIGRDYRVTDKDDILSADYALGRRIASPLKAYEKAELATNANQMYEQLCAVDPRLVSSSNEFADLKRKLKALRDYEVREESFDTDFETNRYRVLAKDVAEAAAKYLRYKTKQMDGSKRGHKRSDLEADRVRVVDAILSNLNSKDIPGTRVVMLAEQVEGVRKTKTGISDTGLDDLPKNPSNYIKLHTGKGAVNGTLEEMRDDFAKATAALIWQKNHPNEQLNVDEVHKLVPMTRKYYETDLLSEKELVKALSNEDSVKRFCGKWDKVLYSVPNLFDVMGNDASNPKKITSFDSYINVARYTYEYIPDSNGKSDTYKQLFNTIKYMAHLKKSSAEYLDHKVLDRKITELNAKAVWLSESILSKTKGKGEEAKGALHVLASLNMIVGKGGKHHIAGTFDGLNIANNKTDPQQRGYIDIKKYGAYELHKAEKAGTIRSERKYSGEYANRIEKSLAKKSPDYVQKKKENSILSKMLKNKGMKLKKGEVKAALKDAPVSRPKGLSLNKPGVPVDKAPVNNVIDPNVQGPKPHF